MEKDRATSTEGADEPQSADFTLAQHTEIELVTLTIYRYKISKLMNKRWNAQKIPPAKLQSRKSGEPNRIKNSYIYWEFAKHSY